MKKWFCLVALFLAGCGNTNYGYDSSENYAGEETQRAPNEFVLKTHSLRTSSALASKNDPYEQLLVQAALKVKSQGYNFFSIQYYTDTKRSDVIDFKDDSFEEQARRDWQNASDEEVVIIKAVVRMFKDKSEGQNLRDAGVVINQ